MLVYWNTVLSVDQQDELLVLDSRVSFWPNVWMESYSGRMPIEWWISFSKSSAGLVWVVKYPELIKIKFW